MGKALLIIVFSASLCGAVLLAHQQAGAVEAARRSMQDEVHQLAQTVAHSGYALGTHRVLTTGDAFSEAGVAYGSGTYDLHATSTPTGATELWATGHVLGARYDVRGEFAQLSSPCDLLGAVFLNTQLSPTIQLSGTGFQIRGEDTRPPSRAGGGHAGGRLVLDGPGYTVGGILTDPLVSESFSVPLGELGELDAAITVGGTTNEGYLRRLVGCLLTVAAEAAEHPTETFAGDRTFRGRTFGSAAAPTFTLVEGDATFRDATRGYGVLLVGGDLVARDDFEWEGLVMAYGRGLAAVRLRDDARIYGGLVGGAVPESSGGLLDGGPGDWTLLDGIEPLLDEFVGAGGALGDLSAFRRPMTFAISDSAGVFHSEEALGRLSELLPTGTASTRTELLNERFGLAAVH